MILETLEHAQKRNAKIFAEICSYGISNDGNHFVKPDENG